MHKNPTEITARPLTRALALVGCLLASFASFAVVDAASVAASEPCSAPSLESRVEWRTRRGTHTGSVCLKHIEVRPAPAAYAGPAYRLAFATTDSARDRVCTVAQFQVVSVSVTTANLRHVAKVSTRTADGCSGKTRSEMVAIAPAAAFTDPATNAKGFGPGRIAEVTARVCLRTDDGTGLACSAWTRVLSG